MKHLSESEKDQIEILLNKGYSKRAISRVLQRNPDSICEEIKRNSVK
ncbi:MAG: helix-turn-helix domain-containing protein [bacterium]